MVIFRPRPAAWLPLLIVAIPIAGLGLASILDGGLLGVGAFGFAAFLVCYVATARIIIDRGQISFSRYGFTLWSSSTDGLGMQTGLGGELPLFPVYVFVRQSHRVGDVPRNWFRPTDIETVRELLANGS